MYKIQANQSGTRSIEVSDLHLETIDKYHLLRNLVLLYVDWKDKKEAEAAETAEPDAVND